MDMDQFLGLGNSSEDPQQARELLQLYINLKLSSSGQPVCEKTCDSRFLDVAKSLLNSYREKSRLLSGYLCPPDQRIQSFIDDYLADVAEGDMPRLPGNTLILDIYGVARELSLPAMLDEFKSEYVSSYRLRNGILHNPVNDRRTTQGLFHVAEEGLPVPADKKSVPKLVFARLFKAALNPPEGLMRLPFTAGQKEGAKIFVSLLLRPIVCPEIPGICAEKNMEIRFFAPGSLVSNLDFVESIFGNGGNPVLAANDAGLDVEHWTGHSGCVILAPHLIHFTKKELGLPHRNDATARQVADGMCWDDEGERYNDGAAFKITARDERGVIITLLADNYFGYCKKEVKTQISYAANLFGLAEEEHAGGALAFPRHNHGEEFGVDSITRVAGYSFEELAENYGELMHLQPQGYGIDKQYSEVVYVPQDLRMDLQTQTINWHLNGTHQSIKLQPDKIYIQPNGYKVEMQKHPGAPSWRLVGTDPEGIFCHKPCTVSGGGKSEISKSMSDAVIYAPLFVLDLEHDLNQVEKIFERDYATRFKHVKPKNHKPSRPLLSAERSLGSVIKVLTPSPHYNDEFNTWLAGIPDRIFALVFVIKRMYSPAWGSDWRKNLSVDFINGHPGHELKLGDRKLIGSYLRVGFTEKGAWRVFKMRQDFIPAEKVQMEDDISASVVVPAKILPNTSPKSDDPSVKLVRNCEYRLFQRPDDAIHRGFDKQTEKDMALRNNFLANFEPLQGDALTEIIEDVVGIGQYTKPMRTMLQKAHNAGQIVVSSAHPRLVDGKPSKNPRYLQLRPDIVNPVRRYIAEIGARLNRRVPLGTPVVEPVNAVLIGRRNNPPAPGVRPLAVYNPIHYQELPELFMDFVCSLTGKSPSTTGAGSEGALTKGPFNALRPAIDLNNALVSFILTGYAGYSTAAGHIGPQLRVDHDISLLVPEIWSRLSPQARDPRFLIENSYLEKIEDFKYQGRTIQASRLGYRITERFVHNFMGKMFDAPCAVFGEHILKPETQDLGVFVDGVENIVEAQQKVALLYLNLGSDEDACPPLRALLHIMATGSYQGRDVHHPDIRRLFTRDALLASDWYQERLEIKQARDIALWKRHIAYLEVFSSRTSHRDEAEKLNIQGRLSGARVRLEQVSSNAYLQNLRGTIGADPIGRGRSWLPT
jgi:hypothetical protein